MMGGSTLPKRKTQRVRPGTRSQGNRCTLTGVSQAGAERELADFDPPQFTLGDCPAGRTKTPHTY